MVDRGLVYLHFSNLDSIQFAWIFFEYILSISCIILEYVLNIS